MKMIIKVLVLSSIFSLLFSSCLLLGDILFGQKEFFRVGNMDFTLWRLRSRGAYIMPYKYKGSTDPSNSKFQKR